MYVAWQRRQVCVILHCRATSCSLTTRYVLYISLTRDTMVDMVSPHYADARSRAVRTQDFRKMAAPSWAWKPPPRSRENRYTAQNFRIMYNLGLVMRILEYLPRGVSLGTGNILSEQAKTVAHPCISTDADGGAMQVARWRRRVCMGLHYDHPKSFTVQSYMMCTMYPTPKLALHKRTICQTLG